MSVPMKPHPTITEMRRNKHVPLCSIFPEAFLSCRVSDSNRSRKARPLRSFSLGNEPSREGLRSTTHTTNRIKSIHKNNISDLEDILQIPSN